MLCTKVAIMAFWKAKYSGAVLNRAWEWLPVGSPMLPHGLYKLEFHLTIWTCALFFAGRGTVYFQMLDQHLLCVVAPATCFTVVCELCFPTGDLVHVDHAATGEVLATFFAHMVGLSPMHSEMPSQCLEVGKSFEHMSQCTVCFAGWGISNGISPDIAVVEAKEEGRLPFSANSAPLLMLLRTPLLITILLGPSFTNPSGGPAGLAASDDLPTVAVGSPGDGLGATILLATPTRSSMPVALSSEDKPTSWGSSVSSRYLLLYSDMATSVHMVMSFTRSFCRTETTSDQRMVMQATDNQ